MDGVDGTKEIILENLPAPDTVHIIAGCNDEDIFIRWDHALWEVIGPEEIKLVMRYDDVEALRSGVVDEFRMRDGSWGFLKMVEEQQTLEDEKEYYYTLIRVAAK